MRVLLHEFFVEHQRTKTVAHILNDRGQHHWTQTLLSFEKGIR